ncbi:MAG: kynureninase [Bacteroidia bacterium]
MQFINSNDFAAQLDEQDNLKSFRQKFLFPKHQDKDVIYFCGNSLGLQPKQTREYVLQELNDWKDFGVEGHFQAKNPWYPYHEFLRDNMALIAGSLSSETVVMNSLTANIHFMLVSFYKPTSKRFKIICESSAFPSDQYALQTQVKFHGFNPDDAIIELHPRNGEYTIRHEDILSTITKHQNELALVFLGNPNYYTGQVFDMASITKAGHAAGSLVGFDLAHGIGNLELHLHDWNVDFAVWCSYKYLNAGPGGVAGAFVHQKHCNNIELIRFAGWWGNDPQTRFTMPHDFVPVKSADAWQLSNAPVLPMAALRASLEIFAEAGIQNLIKKRRLMNDFLRFIINDIIGKTNSEKNIIMITPENENERAAQVSMLCKHNGKKIHSYLTEQGIIADWREPEVLRIAPVPLYNSFNDIYQFGKCLHEALLLNK